MSLRLRAKYQWRRLKQLLLFIRVPAFLGSFTARALLLTLVLFSGGLYVWQVSALTSGGYEIKRMEETIAALKITNQKLETELATAESLASLQSRLPELGMAPATKVVRIGAPRGTVVAER